MLSVMQQVTGWLYLERHDIMSTQLFVAIDQRHSKACFFYLQPHT